MSRSKKAPFFTDQQGHPKRSKFSKRKANKKVRLAKEVASGKAYRKESCSWDIRDWSFYSKDPKAKRK